MIKLDRPTIWTTFFSIFTLIISSHSLTQDLSDLKKICSDTSEANKAFARQAGYDLDLLCSEFEAVGITKPVLPQQPKISRATVSTDSSLESMKESVAETVAPVAVAGVGEEVQAKDLRPFGYDLFANAPTTFAPAASIPVSSDYLLGPGDVLDILFYGKSNNQFSLEINREGFVDFPELGPVGLAGLTYGEAKEMLQSRISVQIIGTQVSISMGSLRSMQIFVLGEAFKPGAYTVSSLSTITHALVSSGGVSDIGSLRKIQLKRQGRVVAELDLYDLLMKGDTSNDVQVQSADVIFIPTVGDLVSVSGQVLRPAIYELKGDERVIDLIELAGGMGAKAYPGSARIERIGDDGYMTALDLDLNTMESQSELVKGGDHLTIDGIIDLQRNSVTLSGHVNYPGIFAYKEGIRISDIVTSINQFPPHLDLNFGLISREDSTSGEFSAIPFRPVDVIENPGLQGDVLLHSGDEVMFFSSRVNRGPQLEKLNEAIASQARSGRLEKLVSISGSRLPGEFPLTHKMRISDLIEAGGGLQANNADLDYALLVREELADEGDINVIGINLRSLRLSIRGEDDYVLLPKDEIMLFERNKDKSTRLSPLIERLKNQTKLGELASIVTSGGAVKFPGEYPLTQDMTIGDLISLSGGLEASAYSQSVEISRSNLENPDRAINKIIVTDLTGSRFEKLEPLDYAEFRTIPEFRQKETISLEGEFVFPGVYAFEKGEMLSSVIKRAGGYTNEAFIGGSVFLRESLKKREQEEIDKLLRMLNEEVAAANIQESGLEISFNQSIAAKKAAIQSLSSAVATGRLVVQLSNIMFDNSQDISLQSGDRLLVPKISQEVTILGEVRRPTSYLFNPKFKQSDYIEQSGGFKDSANQKDVYIVKAGGDIVIPKKGLFRFKNIKESIEPGDTIVVPIDTNSSALKGIPLLSEVSTIIYQLSLGAAAVRSFTEN